jgi:hypothetical protein
MQKLWTYIQKKRWLILATIIALALVSTLLVYRLGSLVSGLSAPEKVVATTPLGWHALDKDPLFLPLIVLRSAFFKFFSLHSVTIVRLPNAIIGIMTIAMFGWLVSMWHGLRTATLASALFATANWTLHISRYASNDVVYLWAIVALLLSNALVHRYGNKLPILCGAFLAWAVLAYIPGIIWFLIINLWWQHKDLARLWRHFQLWWQKALIAVIAISWIPLLALGFKHTPATLRTWLGLPQKLAAPVALLKQVGQIGVHLFIHGPANPDLWLGNEPVFDLFSLTVVLLGIYFYARHWRAGRSRMLASFFLLGFILAGLGGPVGLSILVPLCYLFAAAGVTYLLHLWLEVFPFNPLARQFGIALVALAVAVSCTYNLRAYFIAWPHAKITASSFRLKA